MAKLNCWEVKGCGKELGGQNTDRFGICPSSTEKRLNGVHGGKNAGRACWVLTGTYCEDKIQGTFAEKYNECSKCYFYLKVKSEEGSDFRLSVGLLSKLKQN